MNLGSIKLLNECMFIAMKYQAQHAKIIRRFRASAQLHACTNISKCCQASLKDPWTILKVNIFAGNGWSSMNYPKHQVMNWSLSQRKVLARSILNQVTSTFFANNLVFRSWTLHYKLTRSGLIIVVSHLNRDFVSIFLKLWRQLICSTIALNGWYATQSLAGI